MVYYFEIPEGNLIFMGKDKYENEKLIEYCWDEDVWFHVSDFSSAHVYVRLN
jgi:predicted ribosome quality control (RQC) complex YloA/Tae2 family protein